MYFRSAYIQAFLMLAATAAATGMLRFWPSPAAERLAAFYPPGWSAERSLTAAAAAGAAIVGVGGWANVVIVSPSGEAARAGLLKQGALFFLDADTVEACLGSRTGRPGSPAI